MNLANRAACLSTFLQCVGDAVQTYFAAYVREAVHWDDEPYLTARLSEITRLPSLVVSSCVVSHFSFGFQALKATIAEQLLARYRELARDIAVRERLRALGAQRNLSHSCPSSAPSALQQGRRRYLEPTRVTASRGSKREVLYSASASHGATRATRWRSAFHPMGKRRSRLSQQPVRACARNINTSLHTVGDQSVSRGADDAVIVVARHAKSQDVSWLKNATHPVVFIDKGDAQGRKGVSHLGEEGSSYLSFIIEKYEQLPRWVLFITAHERHWHHALASQLCSTCIDMGATKLGFLNVNHDRNGRMLVLDKPRGQPAELPVAVHARLRRELLGLHSIYDGNQRMPPSAQFWVSRERILARPRSYYQKLLDVLSMPSHPLMAWSTWYRNRRLWGFFLEAYWHYIFGECEFYSLPYAQYHELPLRKGCNQPGSSFCQFRGHVPTNTVTVARRGRTPIM